MRGTLGKANLGVGAVITVIGLIATGCASLRPYDPGPGKRVVVTVPQSIYVSGTSVNVTISNLSDVLLAYPDRFCTTALQRKSGASWITVSRPAGQCSVASDFLDPGQTIVYGFRLPKDVDSGIYRFNLSMPVPVPEDAVADDDDANQTRIEHPELFTPTFKVEGVTAAPVATR